MIGNIIGSVVSNIAGPIGGGEGAQSGGGIGGMLGGLFGDSFSFGSPGGMIEGMLDGLGLPDWAGDIGKTLFSAFTGDVAGASGGFLDILEDAFNDVGLEELGGFCGQAAEIVSGFGGLTGGGGEFDPSNLMAMFDDGDLGMLQTLLASPDDAAAREVRV